MSAARPDRAVRVAIRGRVQGVGFRAWVAHEAGRLGLRGWVRNRRDGSVEAVLAGQEAAIDEMIAACRRGPPSARVEEVRCEPADAGDPDLPAGFEHRPSI